LKLDRRQAKQTTQRKKLKKDYNTFPKDKAKSWGDPRCLRRFSS